MESSGELRRDTEIYEGLWVKMKHDQTRATDIYGELW